MRQEKLPISVFIIAKNEADRISKPILSVRDWVDEIIVIDSGSEDDTVNVSRNLGARVLFNEWKGYGQQKIFGEKQCRNNWILNLDADEEVGNELAVNIKTLFKDGNKPTGTAFKFKWKILFRFENKPPLLAPGGEFVRLYNKNYAGFRDSTIHDSVVVREGRIGYIRGLVYHRCFRDLNHWVNKINFYSGMQAEDYVKNGRKVLSVRLVTEPFFAFIKSYFVRRYFVYGIDGFVGSFLYAYAKLLRLAKAREIIKENEYRAGTESAS